VQVLAVVASDDSTMHHYVDCAALQMLHTNIQRTQALSMLHEHLLRHLILIRGKW